MRPHQAPVPASPAHTLFATQTSIFCQMPLILTVRTLTSTCISYFLNQDSLPLQILEDEPANVSALIGRGSAFAMQSNQFKLGQIGRPAITERDLKDHHRKLEAAVKDFSLAIRIEPRFADSWRRRGQARAAMGLFKEVRDFLQQSLVLYGTSTKLS